MTVSNNAEIFNSKQANTTLMNSVQEVQTQLVVAGMGVDHRVDRGTCPPYFLK